MEPRSVTVTGSFHTQRQQPAHGVVQFIPSRAWVMDYDTPWACLAPRMRLLRDGSFSVQVTPTDSDGIPWHYRVETPAGIFVVKAPWSETGHSLKELIYAHRSGTRSSH